MSNPTPITINDVRVGDTISVKRTWSDVSMTWEGPVFEVEPEVRLGESGAYHIDPRTGSNVTITLLHRPPTRRAITLDDLKDWLREVERLRGVAEANLAMSADLIAMEGRLKEAKDEYRACSIERAEFHVNLVLAREQITHLKHELDRSRNAHGKAELELARHRTTLASIEEYGTEEINAGIELRQENERLRNIISNMEKDL